MVVYVTSESKCKSKVMEDGGKTKDVMFPSRECVYHYHFKVSFGNMKALDKLDIQQTLTDLQYGREEEEE